jgi:hypothetical protein
MVSIESIKHEQLSAQMEQLMCCSLGDQNFTAENC